jgi:hypothetical protein
MGGDLEQWVSENKSVVVVLVLLVLWWWVNQKEVKAVVERKVVDLGEEDAGFAAGAPTGTGGPQSDFEQQGGSQDEESEAHLNVKAGADVPDGSGAAMDQRMEQIVDERGGALDDLVNIPPNCRCDCSQ